MQERVREKVKKDLSTVQENQQIAEETKSGEGKQRKPPRNASKTYNKKEMTQKSSDSKSLISKKSIKSKLGGRGGKLGGGPAGNKE